MKLRNRIALALLILAVFAGSYWAQQQFTQFSKASEKSERVVSMAPSSGEVLFALGLGEQVVGVSRYTTYPPEALDKPKIGGYLDVDLEALLRLEADIVVLLEEQADLAKKLESMGMQTVSIDHMSVGGILDSISILGREFDMSKEAEALKAEIEARVKSVQEATKSNEGRRVLLSIGREFGQGKVKSLVAAGGAGYHQELLELAHFKNAYQGTENFPQLSREHLIAMNPDVIIDMVNSKEAQSVGIENIRADWSAHPELKAVQNQQVYLLVGDQHFVPGPRFIETLEWISQKVKGGRRGE